VSTDDQDIKDEMSTDEESTDDAEVLSTKDPEFSQVVEERAKTLMEALGVDSTDRSTNYLLVRDKKREEYAKLGDVSYRYVDLPILKGKGICSMWFQSFIELNSDGASLKSELWRNPIAPDLQMQLLALSNVPESSEGKFVLAFPEKSSGGSAVAYVKQEGDRTIIEKCVVNPTLLVFGEFAEALLLQKIAKDSIDAGSKEVVIKMPRTQAEGDVFYARCNFGRLADGSMQYGIADLDKALSDASATISSDLNLCNYRTRASDNRFEVTVVASPGQLNEELGIRVDSEDGKTLKIVSVMGGLVKEWNDANPESAVEPDDLILSINGRDDNSQVLMDELLAKSVGGEIRMVVAKPL